ncbi:hypothetical protein DFJ73DRAFT_963693 [Zopfochytrium polystomum]|nr:hypothetical protein DFJ73DRAFT_963693 [Zopfochytrium polystomum]
MKCGSRGRRARNERRFWLVNHCRQQQIERRSSSGTANCGVVQQAPRPTQRPPKALASWLVRRRGKGCGGRSFRNPKRKLTQAVRRRTAEDFFDKSGYRWKDQLERRRTGRHHVTCPRLSASADERQHPQGPPPPLLDESRGNEHWTPTASRTQSGGEGEGAYWGMGWIILSIAAGSKDGGAGAQPAEKEEEEEEATGLGGTYREGRGGTNDTLRHRHIRDCGRERERAGESAFAPTHAPRDAGITQTWRKVTKEKKKRKRSAPPFSPFHK